MAGRPKTVSKDAKPTSISYTPAERMAIDVIRQSRKARNDKRTTTNEIVVDAIWHFLETVEHKKREAIEALLPLPPPQLEKTPSKVTQMPKKKR